MRRRLLGDPLVFFLFVSTLIGSSHCPAGVAAAQAGQAELTGEVRDQAGAAVTPGHARRQ